MPTAVPATPLRLAAALLLASLAAAPTAAQHDGPAVRLAAVDPLLEPVGRPVYITAPTSYAFGLLPRQLTTALHQVFFVADDRQHGPELWVSDGTAVGTRQVVDLFPGEQGSQPWIVGVVRGRVVFWAHTMDRGVELHASDGTPEGTVLLADTCPGDCAGVVLPEFWLDTGTDGARGAAPFGDQLAVTEDAGGCRLWLTDGTAAGTRLADPWGGASCGVVASDGERVWYGAGGGNVRVFDGQHGGRLAALPPCTWPPFWVLDAAPLGRDLALVGRCSNVFVSQLWRISVEQPAELLSPRAADTPLVALGEDLLVALSTGEGPPLPGTGWEVIRVSAEPPALTYFGSVPDAIGMSLIAARPGTQQLLLQAERTQGNHLFSLEEDGTPQLLTSRELVRTDAVAGHPSHARVGDQVLFFSLGDSFGGDPADGRWTWELWATAGTPESTRRVTSFSTPARAFDPHWRLLIVPELAVLRDALVLSADDGDGQQLWGLERGLLSPLGCQPGPETLCLGGERFAVRVDWREPRSGDAGSGRAIAPAGDVSGYADAGYFWFFRPDNLELLVKVLDGTGVNGHHWVFHGPMTDVEYDLHVTDLATGDTRSYHRPAGSLCGGADTAAFPSPPQGPAEPALAFAALPVELPARAAGSAAPAAAVPAPITPVPPACSTGLYLHDGRFRVRVTFRDHRHGDGAPQQAHPIEESTDSGSFWFFYPGNREVLVKVLDGTTVNGHHWVFVGGMTDLAFEVEVLDLVTGAQRSYQNLSGSSCGLADTAF